MQRNIVFDGHIQEFIIFITTQESEFDTVSIGCLLQNTSVGFDQSFFSHVSNKLANLYFKKANVSVLLDDV